MKRRLHSFRFRLVVIPLVVLLLTVVFSAVFSNIVVRESLVEKARELGFPLTDVYEASKTITLIISGAGFFTFIVVGAVLLFSTLRMERALAIANHQVNLIASGVFTEEVSPKILRTSDEIGALGQTIQRMQQSLNTVLANVFNTVLETAESSQALSNTTQETSTSIEEVASTTNQFASTVQMMSDNIQHMVDAARAIQGSAGEGTTSIAEAVDITIDLRDTMVSMEKVVAGLGEQSKQIGQIVEVITEIADQTNLLALNAAIEAARAGEHGRGFAVVADEVRNLAEQSAQSTTKITSLVRNIQAETVQTVGGIKRGLEKAQQSASAVEKSGRLLDMISEQVADINVKIAEVSQGIETISSGSQQLAATTEEQSASIQSIAASAHELSSMSDRLQKLAVQFQLAR